MNPFASVTCCDYSSLNEAIIAGTYSAVVSGFNSFKEGIELNTLCRQSNTPFYILNTSGLFGFFYIDLGSDFTFTHKRKDAEVDETFTINDSKSFYLYME